MGASRLLIPIILGLLAVVIGVTGSITTSDFAPQIQPYLSWSWPILGAITVLFVVFTSMSSARPRRRYVRRVTEDIVEAAALKESATGDSTPLIPKPPNPYFAHRYPLEQNFTGRVRERAMLTQWLLEDDRPVLTLTAIGGMGKSALTWAWLQRDVLGLPLPGLSDESTAKVPQTKLPDGVLWWDFYTTGSPFSEFLDRAISYVSSGEIEPAAISSGYEKALALVDLLQQHNVLLVLDGFERNLRAYPSLIAAYQEEGISGSEGEEARSCSDPVASAFLRGVASGALNGRVLLTSRIFPKELEGLAGQRREDLTAMDPEDAVVFFHAQGVQGTRAEIQAASEPYGYHPLALRILAGVIVEDRAIPGDLRAAEQNLIPLQPRDQALRHQMQASYDSLDRPKRELLSRLSAFRSTMDYQIIVSVFGGRGGMGTGPVATAIRILAALGLRRGPPNIGADLNDLTNRGLLSKEGNRYDMHPLVRQYAYARLTDKERVHTRLRDYFAKVPVPDLNEVRSVEDLAPVIELYHHTVAAGHFDEAGRLFRDRLIDPPTTARESPTQ